MIKFPVISKESIPWRNKLFGKSRKIEFDLHGEFYQLVIENDWRDEHAVLSLEFKVGEVSDIGERFWVRFFTSPKLSVLSESLESVSLIHLPTEIAMLAATVIMEDVLKLLEAKIGHPVQIVNFNHGEPTFSNADLHREKIGFSIRSKKTNEAWIKGTWVSSSAVFDRFLKLLDAIPLTSLHSFDYIPFNINFDVGHTLLTQEVFSTLDVNDIVLIENGANPKSKAVHGRVVGIPYLFKANFDSNKVTVMSALSRDDQQDSKLNPAFARKAPGQATEPRSEGVDLNTDMVDLQLTFNVGHATLSLKELKTLKSGHIFELDTPIAEAVKIMVNGYPIGKGELIQVQDKLGVRVLEFF